MTGLSRGARLRCGFMRLDSQSMATGVELMRRPMPEANVPPDTAPREPPVPLDGAPAVTAVEQVIPAHALVVVGRWRRQQTRCLHAAARGELRLARRLRPEDVWLEHAENSVPAMATWDWDLQLWSTAYQRTRCLPQVGAACSPPQV